MTADHLKDDEIDEFYETDDTWGGYTPEFVTMLRALCAQAKEANALREDAERYRWLRKIENQGAKGPTSEGLIVACDAPASVPRYIAPLAGDSLDAALDAAIAREGGERG